MKSQNLTAVKGSTPAPFDGIRAVFFDIDNTLVKDWSPALPSDRFLRAAADAEKRLEIGVITSRPLPMTSHILKAAHMRGFSILSNGAQIAKGGHITYENVIPKDQCELVMRLLQEIIPTVWVNDDGTDYFVPSRPGEPYGRRTDRWDPQGTRESVPGYTPRKPLVVVVHGADAQAAARIKELVKTYFGTRLDVRIGRQYQESGKTYYVVFVTKPRSAKADAFTRLLKMTGLKTEQIMFVGDGRNDVEMMRLAGVGVALANAVPQAKAASDYLAPAWHDDGAALALEYVISKVK